MLTPAAPAQFVAESQVIVIGEVAPESTSDVLVLRPEAFLKGPVSSDLIPLGAASAPGAVSDCPRANVASGDRVLVYIGDAEAPRYPYSNQVYVLRDGRAFQDGEEPRTEVEVVSTIRGITGQYAVPAFTDSEGAGIDWGNTVLPLGVVLLIIFGIGLVLMRVWHRIDPS